MGHAKSFFARFDKETWSKTDYAAVMVGHIEDYVQNLRLLSLVVCRNLLFLWHHYPEFLAGRKTDMTVALLPIDFQAFNGLC